MATVQTSKQFTINWRDITKGLVIAAISPVIPIVSDTINSGSLTFDWKHIGLTALSAVVAYLVKNFFTPSQTVIKDGQLPGGYQS